MSLNKTIYYPLLSTGSAQEDLSWQYWKIVGWDVKNQNKQIKKNYDQTTDFSLVTQTRQAMASCLKIEIYRTIIVLSDYRD